MRSAVLLASLLLMAGCTAPAETPPSSTAPVAGCAAGMQWPTPGATGEGFRQVFRRGTQIGPVSSQGSWLLWHEYDLDAGHSRNCALGPGNMVRDVFSQAGRSVTWVLARDEVAWLTSYPVDDENATVLHSWTPLRGLRNHTAPAGMHLRVVGEGWIALGQPARYWVQAAEGDVPLLDTADIKHPQTGVAELPLAVGEVAGMPAFAFLHENGTSSVVRVSLLTRQPETLFWVRGVIEFLSGSDVSVAYVVRGEMRVQRLVDGREWTLGNATTFVDWVALERGFVYYLESDQLALGEDFTNSTVRFGRLDTIENRIAVLPVGPGKSFAGADITGGVVHVAVVEQATPAHSVVYRLERFPSA